MNNLIRKFNKGHHKTCSENISKRKMLREQIISSSILVKSSAPNMKNNNMIIPKTKPNTGDSFDKDLQLNYNILKNPELFGNDIQSSLENKEDVSSTHYLTQSLQYNRDSKFGISSNYTNRNHYKIYLGKNITKKDLSLKKKKIPSVTTLSNKKNTNENKNNLNLISRKRNQNCLTLSNCPKEMNISNSNNEINKSFNNKNNNKDNLENKLYKKKKNNTDNKKNQNKKISNMCKTKRKLSNLIEDGVPNVLFPLKSKTQNYLNSIEHNVKDKKNEINKKIRITKMDKKLSNKNKNNSKKKLFIKLNEKNNKVNDFILNDNSSQKKLDDVDKHFKSPHISFLKNTSVNKRFLRNKSHVQNTNLNKLEYLKGVVILNQNSVECEKQIIDSNTYRWVENNYIEKEKGKDFKKEIMYEASSINNEKKGCAKCNNLDLPKKSRISQNDINQNYNVHKKLILETGCDERNTFSKHIFQNNTPMINKVFVFEIGNTKIFNDQYNYIEKFEENKKNNIEYIDSSEQLNHITRIIKKNIEFNKDQKNIKINNSYNELNKHLNKKIKNTPNNEHKKKIITSNLSLGNQNISDSNTINCEENKIKLKKNEKNKKENGNSFGDKDNPFLSNSPNVDNIKNLDDKIISFEKENIGNMENEVILNVKKNNIKNNLSKNKDNFIEKEDLNSHELSIPSNSITINISKQITKNRRVNKVRYKKIKKSNLSNILFLSEQCIESIFNYFDLLSINAISLLNKKYYFYFKPIIHKKIKQKIFEYYKNNPNLYNNKIKHTLMKYSPLSKLSPRFLHLKYADLLYAKNIKYDEEILKDLTRTFPNNKTFKYGNINYNRLYHLLTVYSIYNPKIGYAQGINFLAAHTVLLFEKEEIGFIFLDALLRKFDFEKLLGLKNELQIKMNNIKLDLMKYCPEIFNYLESLSLNHEFFMTNWVITLFSNSMNDNLLFIVWDFLFIYGWKFFRFFSISILNTYKDSIMKEEQNQLTFYMKNILRTTQFQKDFIEIIDKTFILMDKE